MSIRSSYPSIAPSLSLDFAKSRRLDPRITFTRAQTGNIATYTGPDGLVKYAGPDEPRFDHRSTFRTNLLNYSEDFAQSSEWLVYGGATVTSNTTTAPDGSLTADTLTMGASAGVYNFITNMQDGETYTFSVWLKAGTSSTATLFINTSPSDPTSAVVSLTNEWKRYSVTKTIGTSIVTLSSQVSNANGTVYAWGAQLEVGSVATDYIATGPSAVTRTATESLGLLVEEERTNFLLYSKDFSSGWNNNNPSTSTAAQIIPNTTETLSPDGTNNAAKIIQANDGWQRIARGVATNNNNTHTWSIFVKYGNSPMCVMEFTGSWNAGGRVQWNFNTETFDTAINFSNLGYENYANGWYRLYGSWVATSNSGTVGVAWFFPGDDYNGVPTSPASYTYVYGYQVEEGAFPTSYIPTSGTAITRPTSGGFNINLQDHTDIYNTQEGTLVCQFSSLRGDSGQFPVRIHYGSNNRGIGFQLYPASPHISFNQRTDDASTAIQINLPSYDNETLNVAGSYSIQDDIAVLYVGDQSSSINSPEIPSSMTRADFCTQIPVGGNQEKFSGHMKYFAYYPKRLTNDQLQILTPAT